MYIVYLYTLPNDIELSDVSDNLGLLNTIKQNNIVCHTSHEPHEL